MRPSGIVELDYNYRPQDMVKMAGITFDFPEKEIAGATLLANGPYRVYNNRMKGGSLNIWEKKYNNTITGESWDYPEFKGYYSLFYGMKLDCPTPFEVYSGKEDVTLHLFTPAVQEQYDPKRNHTSEPNSEKRKISVLNLNRIVPEETDRKIMSVENCISASDRSKNNWNKLTVIFGIAQNNC